MAEKIKTCAVCGRPFTCSGFGSVNRITCSPECSHKRRVAYKRNYYLTHKEAQKKKKAPQPEPPRVCDKTCEGCRYYRLLNDCTTTKVCHYDYDTGLSRGCPPGAQCTRKEKKHVRNK